MYSINVEFEGIHISKWMCYGVTRFCFQSTPVGQRMCYQVLTQKYSGRSRDVLPGSDSKVLR